MAEKLTYEELEQKVEDLEREAVKRKKVAEALLESEDRHKRIFENLQDVYYEASMDGTILEVSPSIGKSSQYKREELIGKSLYDIYRDPKERDELVKLILDKGKVNEHEIHLKDKDGSERLCSINTLLVRDSLGTPVTLIGSMRDIAENKRAEEALRESKERFRNVYDTAPLAFVVWDNNTRVTDWNKKAEDVFGWSKEEEVGQEMLEELGYCVFTTPSGEKAIEMIKQKGNGINMVILDLIMPGMDGSKVFDGIREIIPQMPILLSSGYAINGQAEEVMQKGCNGFIQKPFNLAGLSIKIRQILDGKNKD